MNREESKVLGHVGRDEIVVDVDHVYKEAVNICPTKRNIVSIVSKFYHPVGFISAAIIPFKIFFQELCESKVEWDEPLPRALNLRWNQLLEGLRIEKPICIAR